MKLRRLRARNFRRFADLDLDGLGDGLVAVIGPNESGKSTIGEALVLALAGPPSGWDPVRAIRWEQDAAEVSALVELEDGRRVAIRRAWDRAGNLTTELHDPSQGDAPMTDQQAVTQWEALVGADPASLRALLRLPQGEFERLKRGTDTPGQRWERLAGVPRLRTAAERAREFAAGAAHRLDGARGDLRAAEALVDELGGAPEALAQAEQAAADAQAAIGDLQDTATATGAARDTARAARELRERAERDLTRIGTLAQATWTAARRLRLRAEAATLAAAAETAVARGADRRRVLGEQRTDVENRRTALEQSERLLAEAAAAAGARARGLADQPEPEVPGGGGGRAIVGLIGAGGLGAAAWWVWTHGAPDAITRLLAPYVADLGAQRTAVAAVAAALGGVFALLLLSGLWNLVKNGSRAGRLRAAREARTREVAACEAVVAEGAARLREAADVTADAALRELLQRAIAAVESAPSGDGEAARAALRAEEDRIAREDAQAAAEGERCTAIQVQLTTAAGDAAAGSGAAPGTVAEIEAHGQALLQELAALPVAEAGAEDPSVALGALAAELDAYARPMLSAGGTEGGPPALPPLVAALAQGGPESRPALDAACAQWRAQLPPLDGLVRAEQDAVALAERGRAAVHDAEARHQLATADCERLRPQADRARAARAEAQRLGEGLATLAAEEAVAREAADLLAATIADVIGRLRPALTAVVSMLLPRVTANRYHAARVDEELAIRVRSPETGDWIPIGDLSGSASDQVLFCVRTATMQAMRAVRGIGSVALPLYLDQPLAAFDDQRTAAFVQLLRSLQRDLPQMLLASIRESVASGADHVLRTTADQNTLHWSPQAE